MTGPFEHGSELHWLDFEPCPEPPQHPWSSHETTLYSSGRDALRALLGSGPGLGLDWRRLWVPSYFCQEVVEAVASSGLELVTYRDTPLAPGWPAGEALRPGDVVLWVNTFGLRLPPDWSPPTGVTLVEDHTHDPWSPAALRSRADYCLASLRKTLPLADGAPLWSPAGRSLPPAPTPSETRSLAVASKLSGMLLKSLYLDGHAVEKGRFRELAIKGEESIASGQPAPSSSLSRELLTCMPVRRWRKERRTYVDVAAAALGSLPGVRTLRAESEDCVPFSLLLLCDSEQKRDRLRAGLIEHAIYPAVLWPLPRTAEEASLSLSRRLLSIHADMRYDAAHMERVSQIVERVALA